MVWAKPAGANAAPLAVLGGAVFLLLFNPFGMEAALARLAFAAFGHAAPRHPAPHVLLPLRLAEIFWLLGFGGSAIALLRRSPLASCVVALGGAAGGLWTAWLLFVRFGLLFDAASMGLGLVLTAVAMAVATMAGLWLARMNLRLAFADSLPLATIEKIVRHPELLKTGGEIRECSYLVCGLRGLEALGVAFADDPAAFTALMSQALSPLMDQVLAHGGTLDRLTADGFAAFWNAPLDDAAHATHACEAANGMAVMAARVNETLAERRRGEGKALPIIEIGVGLATGKVIAGAFGGLGRLGYSVHGAAVTQAARIQALSHHYGPAVIVSDATRQAADRSFAFLEVDTVATAPSDPPVTLFALVGNPVLKASPKFRALSTFHDHIFQALRKQQWRQARALIEQCRRLSGASPKLYELHLGRIGHYENYPPGENWDGAFRPILK